MTLINGWESKTNIRKLLNFKVSYYISIILVHFTINVLWFNNPKSIKYLLINFAIYLISKSNIFVKIYRILKLWNLNYNQTNDSVWYLNVFKNFEYLKYVIYESLWPACLYLFMARLLKFNISKKQLLLILFIKILMIIIYDPFFKIFFLYKDKTGKRWEDILNNLFKISGLLTFNQNSYKTVFGFIRPDFIIGAGLTKIICDAKEVFHMINYSTLTNSVNDLSFKNYPAYIEFSFPSSFLIIPPDTTDSYSNSDIKIFSRLSNLIILRGFQISLLFWFNLLISTLNILIIFIFFYQWDLDILAILEGQEN